MSNDQTLYQRFSRSDRFEHVVLIVAFIGLLITGLPQMYASYSLSKTWVDLLGGIESVRILHRVFSALLIVEAFYHLLALAYKRDVLHKTFSMLPGRQDFRNAWHWVQFNLGMRDERPAMPWFNFADKWDYWHALVGVFVMIITGLILWNPIAVTQQLPGQIIPTARTIHGGEALLLLLVFGVGHLYRVLVYKFNRSMFTGRLRGHQVAQDHAAALDHLDSEPMAEAPAAPQWKWLPVMAVIAFVAAVAMLLFLTSETTAISTIPRQEVIIFAPEVDLEDGNASVGEAIWSTVRCSTCHGYDAVNGRTNDAPALADTDLNFDGFYEQVRIGTDTMPAFSEEDLPDSYLVHIWTWLTESGAESDG